MSSTTTSLASSVLKPFTDAARTRILSSLASSVLPPEFQPQFVNGKWRKPVFSGRARAAIRKEFLLSGQQWSFDVPEKRLTMRVRQKGHKHERSQQEYLMRIQVAMKDQPRRQAEYQKILDAKKNTYSPIIDVFGQLGAKHIQKEREKEKNAAKAKTAANKKKPENAETAQVTKS